MQSNLLSLLPDIPTPVENCPHHEGHHVSPGDWPGPARETEAQTQMASDFKTFQNSCLPVCAVDFWVRTGLLQVWTAPPFLTN